MCEDFTGIVLGPGYESTYTNVYSRSCRTGPILLHDDTISRNTITRVGVESSVAGPSTHFAWIRPKPKRPEETAMQEITAPELLTFFFSVGVLLYLWIQ
jgi:hypothetical protein